MAQERLTMRKIREGLRVKWECGMPTRAIARSCSISHSTVGEYLRRAKEAGLSWPLPDDLDEDGLFELLFPKPPEPGARAIPCPDWSWVHAELRKKSVTLRLLWVEYRQDHPTGYGYSQFCALYRKWAKLSVRMGLNQGYFSYGLSVKALWFLMEYAGYGEEVGTLQARHQNRIHLFRISMDF